MTDFDNEGNFNGFLIRPDVAKMIMWRGKGQMDQIYKIIKTVNYLNRLLLESGKDYILGSKKVQPDQADAFCQVDTYEPVVVEKEARPKQEPKKENAVEMICSPILKEFMNRLKEHVINIIIRDDPKKKTYYNLVLAD